MNDKNIDEYIKDIWKDDVKKFIINSHAEAYIHRLERENQQLKKQKDDVVEYIKSVELGELVNGKPYYLKEDSIGKDLLRMLGEIDEI